MATRDVVGTGAAPLPGNWTPTHTWGLALITAAVGSVGWWAPTLLGIANGRFAAWLVDVVLLALFIAVAGHGITGVWRGALIDERNKLSLSRLQMLLWTVILLAGFLTAALANLASGQDSPLTIAIPAQLWVAMGISTTALAGSPLILGAKAGQQPAHAEKEDTLTNLAKQEGISRPDLDSTGLVVQKLNTDDATWADLFKGEETGNADTLDLGKIQLFYFTAILALTYAVAMALTLLGSALGIHGFPQLDQSMIALLAISNAGYLMNQAAPHSQTA